MTLIKSPYTFIVDPNGEDVEMPSDDEKTVKRALIEPGLVRYYDQAVKTENVPYPGSYVVKKISDAEMVSTFNNYLLASELNSKADVALALKDHTKRVSQFAGNNEQLYKSLMAEATQKLVDEIANYEKTLLGG